MKRKYFSKDMNYERYLIILGKSLHAPPIQHLLMCLLLRYLQKLLRKIQREAAENEWNERNYDIVVRICYSKRKIYMYRDLIDSSVQEESSGLDLMDKSFSKRDIISTSNNDKPDVWAFVTFCYISINF
jgi:hypothetical protein